MTNLNDLLDDLLTNIAARNLSNNTVLSTRGNCRRFIDWLEDAHDIIAAEALTPKHITDYQAHLAGYVTKNGVPMKPSSLNTAIKCVRRLLQYAFDQQLIARNLSERLQYVKEPQILPTSVLLHNEVKKLIGQIDVTTEEGIRDRAAIELLYSSGMRIGELETLTLDDVDFDIGAAKVCGKGDKERIVPLGRTARRYLENYVRATRPFFAVRAASNGADPKDRHVFLNNAGRPLQGYVLRANIHKYAEAAGIDLNVTPHTFRRSCTSEMIKANANLYHVKELLGHESFNTLKHYTKLNITDLKKTHTTCHPREKEGKE